MRWKKATEADGRRRACMCQVHNDIKLNSSTIFIYYLCERLYMCACGGKQIVLNIFNDESAYDIECEGKLRA
jgi:hypothetical protein